MGYTTYWRQEGWSQKDRQGWDNALPTIKKILDKYKNIIQRENEDDRDAIANSDHIIFNGIEDDAHETFHAISGTDTLFSFCKTARKPYDIVVSEVCLVLDAYCPHFKLSSDGFSLIKTDELSIELDCNWEEAIKNVLEYGVSCVLKASEDGELNVSCSVANDKQ